MPIYQSLDRLFVQFDFQGQTYKKRLPEKTTRAEAVKFETKWKHDLFFDVAETPKEDPCPTFKEFAEDVFLPYVKTNNTAPSLEKAIVILKAATPFFGDVRLDKIKAADLERFKAMRMNTPTLHGHPRMASTIHREMSVLSRLFNLAVRNDLCEYNPCRRIDLPKFDNIQDRILRYDDEERFLFAIHFRLQRDICITVLYTGLRQNDVLGLRKDQVDFIDNEIRLIQGKTKRRVNIPMLQKVRDILIDRLDNDSDLFFPSYRGGGRMKSLKSSVIAACERARIPRLTIRDLRRTFGTRLHENGFDDKTIADLLGHAGLRSVHRYKRGTEIKKRAILSLEKAAESCQNPTTLENGQIIESVKPNEINKTVVEMRRIELLASALRTDKTMQIIH